jgi:hypothetical protein
VGVDALAPRIAEAKSICHANGATPNPDRCKKSFPSMG